MSNLKCDGECSRENRCKGDVHTVLVSGNGFNEPFQFNYCETAIKEDRENGFDVEFIDEHGLTKHDYYTGLTP